MSVRNCINGTLATKFREDGDEYDVKVRLKPEDREDIVAIENISLKSSSGNNVRIGDVSEVKTSDTPPTIERKDLERVVTVSAVMAAGAALSDGVEYGMKVINEIQLPTGYSIQVETSN